MNEPEIDLNLLRPKDWTAANKLCRAILKQVNAERDRLMKDQPGGPPLGNTTLQCMAGLILALYTFLNARSAIRQPLLIKALNEMLENTLRVMGASIKPGKPGKPVT